MNCCPCGYSTAPKVRCERCKRYPIRAAGPDFSSLGVKGTPNIIVLYGAPTMGKSVLSHWLCHTQEGAYWSLEQAPESIGLHPVRYVSEPPRACHFLVIDSYQVCPVEVGAGDFPYPVLLISQVTLENEIRGGMDLPHLADAIVRLGLPKRKRKARAGALADTRRMLIVEKDRGTLDVPRSIKADLMDWLPDSDYREGNV